MKRLILQRHAKTEPWYEGVDDHGRALTERGRKDAVFVAQALQEEGWTPDLVIISTARRARETWAGAVSVFQQAKYTLEDDLYLAGSAAIESVIRAYDGSDTLMLIGHNPGFQDYAREIQQIAGSLDHQAALRLSEKFPTGCAALFEADEDGAFEKSQFKLVDVIRAKDLREDD